MNTRWMKIAALAACLTMLFAVGARAEGTTLTVLFQGLRADGNGAWQVTGLSGEFDVSRDGAELGRVSTEGEALALTGGGNVLLTPVAGTMPEGYLVDGTYSASITDGTANRAAVMVYADAGLFRFSGTPGETHTLLNARGEQVMTCQVSADGVFTPAEAVASGWYILLGADGSAEAVFEVQPYKGAAEQITQVTLAEEGGVALVVDTQYDLTAPVLMVRLGQAEGQALAALPAGWRVVNSDACIHGQDRDYVLLAHGVTAFDVMGFTQEKDACWYPVEAEAALTEELVFSAMEGKLEEQSAQVHATIQPEVYSDVGETICGLAEPGKRLTLTTEDGLWLAEADAEGQFAFCNVTGEGRYAFAAEGGPFAEMDALDARVQDVDMRMPMATAAPTEEATQAPEAAPAPTLAPTEAPTAVPTQAPTQVPTEAPQASGLSGSATLTVEVFIDANNNGERGKYEKMLAGTKVTAWYRMPGGYLSEAASAETDAEGQATLANLPAGEYALEVTLPAGYGFTKKGKTEKATSNFMDTSSGVTATSETFALGEGEGREIGVGAMHMASISGVIWLDDNANGVKNEGEGGQAGVQLQLVGTKNGMTYETVSGADGSYAFTQVLPGVYKLQVTAPEGMGFTPYSASGGANRSVITTEGAQVGIKQYELKSGEEKTLQHVGLIRGATIRGACFLDANYNGFLDEGEAALSGVKLELIKQASGKSVTTMVCGEDGLFSFSGLREGTYRVRAVLPEGAAYTCVVEGGNQFKARTGRREYTVENIAVSTGETRDMVVGAILPATISGVAYLDDDFSGTQNGKEKVVSGMVVYLWDAAGNQVATDRTSAKGVYTFEDLTPGQYRLTTSAKKGYAFTRLGDGNVMLNLSDGEGESELFTVQLGDQLTDMDMGMILPGVVEGVFFADQNDNGVQDADEGGLKGTMVRLMSEEGEHFAAEIGEDGAFRFDAVMPGRYYLRYELPEGGVVAVAAKGGNTLTGDQVGATDWFNFAAGDTYQAPLAGGLLLGEISGTVFADHNGSGVQEAGEEAISDGVTLVLTPSRRNIDEATVIPGADGSFYFGSLRPDTYTLTVSWEGGLVMSRTDGLQLPLLAGLTGQNITIDLAMGDRYTGQALGGMQPASLQGQAWLDESNDGIMDAQEARPEGVTITVTDEITGNTYATLRTGADGSFHLDGIIPGSYTLTCQLTDGLTAPKAGDSTFAEAAGRLVMEHVTLAEGSSLDGLLLGLVQLNTISGSVWVDEGGSYAMLSDAVVSLTDAYGAPIDSVITGEDGAYAFTGLMPDDYYVAVTLPEGYLVVEPEDERLSAGGMGSAMAQCNGRTGQSAAITVEMTGEYTGLDIGGVLPGRLGDYCWLDENGNGLQDSGEMGLSGVKIELMRGDRVMAEAVSDQYGYWCMEEVYPATYTLRVTPPAEVKPTQRNTQVPSIASVLEESEEAVCMSGLVTVVSDRSNYQADLGFVLRKSGVYPEGYGVFETQDWTKIVWDD